MPITEVATSSQQWTIRFEPTHWHGNTKSSIVYTRGSASADSLQKFEQEGAPARSPDLAVKVGIVVELSHRTTGITVSGRW